MSEKEPIVALVRVSTDKQAKGSDSPQVQENFIRQWADLSNKEVVAVYGSRDEGVSGTIPALDRPDTAAAIEHAISLHCAIVVYSLDRFGRDGLDLVETGNMLVDKGANLIALADGLNLEVLRASAVGKLLYWIQAGLAQFVRDQTSEKTCTALRSRRQNGQRVGKVPYGYRVDMSRPENRIKNGAGEVYHPHLDEDPDEQARIAMIHTLADKGMSQSAIARYMNDQSLPCRNGPWHHSLVGLILKRKT